MRAGRSLILVLIATLVMATPAGAQTGKQFARDTVVIANGDFFPLASVRITANKGDKFYVNSRMQTKAAKQDPTHRMLVALLLGCADDVVELRSTQNIDYGKNVLKHTGRYIFEAPRDGEFECRLQARGGIHGQQSNPPAQFTVDGANTFLAVSGRQPAWVTHKYQDKQRLTRIGKARDLVVMSFTAPQDVAKFSATADVELTNCYNAGYLCDTIPSNRRTAVVNTRLVAMQRDRNGGYCNITRWPESGMKRTSITWAEHHKMVYHRMADIPVRTSSQCTREFRVKVYMKVLSGNPIMTEGKPYSNVFVMR